MADPRKGKRPSRGKPLLFKGIHGRDFRVRPGEVGWDIDIREPGGEFQPHRKGLATKRIAVAQLPTTSTIQGAPDPRVASRLEFVEHQIAMGDLTRRQLGVLESERSQLKRRVGVNS